MKQELSNELLKKNMITTQQKFSKFKLHLSTTSCQFLQEADILEKFLIGLIVPFNIIYYISSFFVVILDSRDQLYLQEDFRVLFFSLPKFRVFTRWVS